MAWNYFAGRSQDGRTIAVGNKEDLVSFIDVKYQKVVHEEQFKFEVNEIAFNLDSNLFFLTNGQVSTNLGPSYPGKIVDLIILSKPKWMKLARLCFAGR